MEASLSGQALHQLRRSWIKVAALWLLAWLGGFAFLQARWPFAGSWLLLSGAVLAYNLWALWRYLPENVRARNSAEILPTLGPGNQLTLMRGLMLGLLAGFMFRPWPQGALAWLVVGIYTVASIADYLDGYLARRADHVTELGSRLDMTYDGQGLLVVSLLAVWWGQLPWWFLSVGLARYLFIWGLAWRERHGKPTAEIPPSVHRRMLAGTQMGLMTVVLWPIVPAPMAQLGGSFVALLLLLGFGRDWLIASTRLNPQNERYNLGRVWVWRLTTRWLPPVWRGVLLLSMLAIFGQASPWWQPAAWEALIQSWGVPAAPALATLLSVIGLLVTPLVVAGFLGRSLSLFLLLPIGFDIATRGLTPASGLALTAVTWLFVFGTGVAALNSADDAFFLQRAGESPDPSD